MVENETELEKILNQKLKQLEYDVLCLGVEEIIFICDLVHRYVFFDSSSSTVKKEDEE